MESIDYREPPDKATEERHMAARVLALEIRAKLGRVPRLRALCNVIVGDPSTGTENQIRVTRWEFGEEFILARLTVSGRNNHIVSVQPRTSPHVRSYVDAAVRQYCDDTKRQ